jgi:carbon starvation protein CstA
MNTLWVVVIGGVIIYLAYNLYAKRIDRAVIQADPERSTPARMYMDGADFMPTSRFVLYGYHFKSIAAAGPIIGVITAANLWGWLPSIIWLMVGVSFIGWVSDYTAIMLAVRNDGNSLSAIAHRLIAPRVRTILYVFIFFYLLLVGGAFVGIMAGVLDARPDVPFGILVLALAGLAAGWLIYRKRADLILVTIGVVLVTVLAMALGPAGADLENRDFTGGAISGPIQDVKDNLNGDDKDGLYAVQDPTLADARVTRDPATGKPIPGPTWNAKTSEVFVFPSYILWAIFLLIFAYLGANLPIWRFAQPVNYIGFWVTAITIGISAIGAGALLRVRGREVS